MNLSPAISRRRFLVSASTTAAVSGFAASARPIDVNHIDQADLLSQERKVQLSQIHGPSEQDESAPGPFLPNEKRIGYAIVGLGRLSINQILPGFGQTKYCKPAALVSGDRVKARKIAAQYGIPETSIYAYNDFERLSADRAVQVIYIVLPNGMHEEYVTRGAKTGKHILCEKPMANSSAEAQRMIEACSKADVKLMIAYRQQYEPHNIALRKLIEEGQLGKLRGFLSTNSQLVGDPTQWRLKRTLSGGGCLPDVGIYCVNASRFLSGEEPTRVTAQLWKPKQDPRFAEVEATVSFTMAFPSGYLATCTTSYDAHKSQSLRIEGSTAWAEMLPAYAYHGNKLRISRLQDGAETLFEPQIEEKDQFALEMDHFAECILAGRKPRTPGEEGLQDHRILEAIYKAAETGHAVDLVHPSGGTRG